MFQSNAFQSYAFQINEGTANSGLLGGKAYDYTTPYSRYKEEEYQRQKIAAKRAELQRVENEIIQIENKRQIALQRSKAVLALRNVAKKQAALEASLQEEINRLRILRVWLIRWIDDEEAILVLLLSQPF